MEQIERITAMEQHLDRAAHAVKQLMEALEQFDEARDDIQNLEAYYGSEEWNQDYDDDSAGRLPADLKRGVLSEDAVWNLLDDCRQLNVKMLETVITALK